MNDTIVVVNGTTVLTDADIQAVIPAFQQSANDFESVWKLGAAKVEFSAAPAAGEWLLEVLDHTDTPGAGGYHLDANGQVSGKVFAGDFIDAGAPWTIAATHELLEMIGDPFANMLVPLPHSRLEWFQEVCDPVEGDQFAYMVGDVPVTDFVTPAYKYAANCAYDFKGHLHAGAPALLPGGYITLYDPRRRRYIQHFAQQADGTTSLRAKLSHRPRRLVHG